MVREYTDAEKELLDKSCEPFRLGEVGSSVQEIQKKLNEIGDIDLTTKQDTLVSGENIKTINDKSLLGKGNLEILGEVYSPELWVDDDGILWVSWTATDFSDKFASKRQGELADSAIQGAKLNGNDITKNEDNILELTDISKTDHTHDSLYAEKEHEHGIVDVKELQTALNGKQAKFKTVTQDVTLKSAGVSGGMQVISSGSNWRVYFKFVSGRLPYNPTSFGGVTVSPQTVAINPPDNALKFLGHSIKSASSYLTQAAMNYAFVYRDDLLLYDFILNTNDMTQAAMTAAGQDIMAKPITISLTYLVYE